MHLEPSSQSDLYFKITKSSYFEGLDENTIRMLNQMLTLRGMFAKAILQSPQKRKEAEDMYGHLEDQIKLLLNLS